MDKIRKTIGIYIIGSAIIWGVVIIGCSLILKGTDCFSEISNILIAGAVIHLLFIWGPMAAQLKKSSKKE